MRSERWMEGELCWRRFGGRRSIWILEGLTIVG